MRSMLRVLCAAVLVASGTCDKGSYHRLDLAYIPMLAWWCEEMDHEADPLCNLLFADRHLSQTADGTQLRGLDQTMVSYKPTNNQQVVSRLGPILKKFCAAKNSGQVCSKLKAGRLMQMPGVFKGDQAIAVTAAELDAAEANAPHPGAIVAVQRLQPAADTPTPAVPAPQPASRTPEPPLREAGASPPRESAQGRVREPLRPKKQMSEKSASAAKRLWLPPKGGGGRADKGGGLLPARARDEGGGPDSADDILSVASWACRDGLTAVSSTKAARSVCNAFRDLLDALPALESVNPMLDSPAKKQAFLRSIDAQRRLARMNQPRDIAAPIGVEHKPQSSNTSTVFILLGMVLAASPFLFCYFVPAARGAGTRVLAGCNSCCMRVHLGLMQGKLYHLLSRKNTARREAERVVRSLCQSSTAAEGESAEKQNKDSA